MKCKTIQIIPFFMSFLMLTACSAPANSTQAAGPNPYYDEINKITWNECEFHLGDTLADIKSRYGQLIVDDEEIIPAEDFEDRRFFSWNGRMQILHRIAPYLSFTQEDGTEVPFLYTTIENTTKHEVSSYETPITQYDTGQLNYKNITGLSVPSDILDAMALHYEETGWEAYDETKLCYTLINDPKRENPKLMSDALVVVFKDNTYNEYLYFYVKGVLDPENKKLLPELLLLENVVAQTPQKDKSTAYADHVLAFVKSGRNREYFLNKDGVTYTILEPYKDFLANFDLTPATGQKHTFQPATDTLGAYGNESTADTVRYSLKKKDPDSSDLFLPVISNFTQKTIDTEKGLITRLFHYGLYDTVSVPDNVQTSIKRYWKNGGSDPIVYEFPGESIRVAFEGASDGLNFFYAEVEITPEDHPEITVCYGINYSSSGGRITDANFWLKDQE